MDYIVKGSDILLNQADFNLDETLDCGQAFRWRIVDDYPEYFRTYTGFFGKKPLTVSQLEENGSRFLFHNTTEDDMINIWCDYFDLRTDYGEIKRRFSEDEFLSKACDYAGGIRILRQDTEECLISFIISQNNNIPRIKGILDRLCEHCGGFPTFGELADTTAGDLGYLRAGFRAKYLEDCINKVNSGALKLNEIKNMSTDDARQALMTVKGVGPKVADCVMLFGMYKIDSYPKDVWIKRVNEKHYPNGLPQCTKGIEGIAQQYLFHYIRQNGE
ncbi:MAG: DNA-3-methyladenine glycosylase 2 family protein [Oscillospiraceae bacterium]|nr:DNA-3-methyladenine glycosylase 2 family protein [Oscillospiraceae bacterium]